MAVGKQITGVVHQKSGALTTILVNTVFTGGEPVFGQNKSDGFRISVGMLSENLFGIFLPENEEKPDQYRQYR